MARSWDSDIKTLGRDYYLKIWFFENRFISTQLVAAIGGRIDWYRDKFYKNDNVGSICQPDFPTIKKDLDLINWELYYDEDEYWESDFADETNFDNEVEFEKAKKYFEKIKLKSHRYEGNSSGNCYYLNRGKLWIGTVK